MSFSENLTPTQTQWCDCTVEYSEEGIGGKDTKMIYQGNTSFKCPNCGRIEDMQRDTYKVRLQFKKEGKHMTVKILEPLFDKRLLGKWDEDSTGTIKETLTEDLNEWGDEEEFYHLGRHPEGIFDVELLYNYYRCSYEYEEYDMNLEIIAEKGISTK